MVKSSFSLDAGAGRVQIVRARERGLTTLHIIDDGGGVLPEMTREDALGYIATHIGHSRKRNLTLEPPGSRGLSFPG